MKSKAYEKYELHPKRKMLEALADIIPESGGFVLISDDEKILAFDVTSVWDYGSAESIIELSELKNAVHNLSKRRDELQRQVNSKTKKVSRLEKLQLDLRKELRQ